MSCTWRGGRGGRTVFTVSFHGQTVPYGIQCKAENNNNSPGLSPFLIFLLTSTFLTFFSALGGGAKSASVFAPNKSKI